ncbi:MAG: TolC family protein [Pseudomonadota bacterium]
MNGFLRESLEGRDPNLASYLKGKEILELTLDEACRKAVKRNLELKMAHLNQEITHRETAIKDAAFDPVFDVSLSYRTIDSYERFEDIGRERRKEVDWEEFDNAFRKRAELEDLSELTEEEDPTCVGCTPCIYIDGVLMNPWECESKYEYSLEREYASINLKHGAIPDVWTGSLRASKKLSWGQEADLTLRSTKRSNPYPSLGPYAALYTYDNGVFQFPYGDNPWSSALSFNFSSPVPFCKNFGQSGSFENVDSVLARMQENIQSSRKREVERVVIEDVKKTYWDLTGALKRLQIMIDARNTLKAMAERTIRLFKQGYKTSYDRAQVEADLGNMENRVEIAWNELVIKSNRLMELLGMAGDTLILPLRYSRDLTSELNIDPARAVVEAFDKRPDLKVVQTEYESSDTLYGYRKNQVKPDITFSFSFSLSQTDAYWGYFSLMDSWEHLADPDNENYFMGIVFRWPIGNHAAKSALRRSRAALRRNKTRITLKKNDIVKEVNTAISAVEIINNQISFAKKNLERMAFAYEKALELREDNRQVSDFELLRKYNELINSRLVLLNALIGHKKSQVELLSAKGEFPEHGRVVDSSAQ